MGEIGGRLGVRLGEIDERLGEIGGRLGEEMAHVLHFFCNFWGNFFYGARLTFCEQLATWLVLRQGSQGSNVRVIFVFSLTLEAVSLTFEPYLKIQKSRFSV